MDTPSFPPANEPAYGEPVTPVSSDGQEVFVISDLHLASGLNQSRNYDGTENFFTDDAFVRFVDHLQSKQTGKAILLINGDFIDFLRIRNIPANDQDFYTWNRLLSRIGIQKPETVLQASIGKKEKEYGLKTHDYKSVWKLWICFSGHPRFFERLARWLQDGNRLVVTKGNHDLEWYWPAVRNAFRLLLADTLATKEDHPVDVILTNTIIPHTQFADHAVVLDGVVYAEHGHRFDSTTAVKGAPLLQNGEEINLPFGSFFNRYLINRLELSYPYLDNVRPTRNILLVLLRERFPLALKMLFYYVPFMLLIIPKKLYWETFKYLLSFLFVIVLPVAITVYAIWQGWNTALFKTALLHNDSSFIKRQILSVVKNFGFLFLSYIFGRILVFVKLKAPWSFYPDARNILLQNTALEMVTFGHTHNPEQQYDQPGWYYNTGTWIPVYESSSASVRFDKTFTFLQISTMHKANSFPTRCSAGTTMQGAMNPSF